MGFVGITQFLKTVTYDALLNRAIRHKFFSLWRKVPVACGEKTCGEKSCGKKSYGEMTVASFVWRNAREPNFRYGRIRPIEVQKNLPEYKISKP